MVFWLMAAVGCPPDGALLPEKVWLLPVTEQEFTLETLQKSLVVLPLGTSCGWICRWPVLPPDALKVGVGSRQTEEPAEQKEGVVQEAKLELMVTVQEALVEVWTTLEPEHE